MRDLDLELLIVLTCSLCTAIITSSSKDHTYKQPRHSAIEAEYRRQSVEIRAIQSRLSESRKIVDQLNK